MHCCVYMMGTAQGNECTGLYVVISGRVRTFSRRKSGKFSFESSDEDDDDEEEPEEEVVDGDGGKKAMNEVQREDLGR
jgi:hypothetical protein